MFNIWFKLNTFKALNLRLAAETTKLNQRSFDSHMQMGMFHVLPLLIYPSFPLSLSLSRSIFRPSALLHTNKASLSFSLFLSGLLCGFWGHLKVQTHIRSCLNLHEHLDLISVTAEDSGRGNVPTMQQLSHFRVFTFWVQFHGGKLKIHVLFCPSVPHLPSIKSEMRKYPPEGIN